MQANVFSSSGSVWFVVTAFRRCFPDPLKRVTTNERREVSRARQSLPRQIPNQHGSVRAARGEAQTVGAKREGLDLSAMSGE